MNARVIENDLRPLTAGELADLDRIATCRECARAFRVAHPEYFEEPELPIVHVLTGDEAEAAWLDSAGMPLGVR